MTLINPIEKLEIINEYYAGLRNALHIDSLLLNQWNLKNDKLDLAEIEKKIFETPSDENLKKTMQGPYSSLLLYIFLRLPLLQADIYEKQNCLLLFEPDFAPPSYCLDDTDEMIEALSRMSRLGREQIINYYTKASFPEIVLLKKAIFDLDKNSLKQLLDTKNVDLTWIQKLLGLFCYMEKTKDGIVHGNMSKNEYLSIIQPSILELLDVDTDDRYQSEFLDKMFQLNSIINKDDIDADKFVNTLFEQSNACLKLYWSEQEIYKEQSRTIIDDYINKPCFEEFVSKCRAEFEEEEKERRNCDFSWLPENYFRDSNPPDTKKKNHLTNIMDAVTHGWFYKNGPQSEEEKNGDGRKKFMTLINECARLNFIKDDNETKARMAYVLTGRNVGFDIDEEKPLVWNYEYKNYLFYLLKFLFKRAPHKIAFSMIDGIGEYASINPITGEMKSINHSEHAEELDMKSFPAFAHSLYEFCPPSKTPKGGGKQITNRSKNSKKQENS